MHCRRMVVLKLSVGSAPGGWRLSDASACWIIDSESRITRGPWVAFGQYMHTGVKVQRLHQCTVAVTTKVWLECHLRTALTEASSFTFPNLSDYIKVCIRFGADIFIDHIIHTEPKRNEHYRLIYYRNYSVD